MSRSDGSAREASGKAVVVRLLSAAFLFLQLCLPGLQASMLKLGAPTAAQSQHHEHGEEDGAPASHEAHFKCSICAAASLPASLPPRAAALPSRAPFAAAQAWSVVAPSKLLAASPFAARAPPAA